MVVPSLHPGAAAPMGILARDTALPMQILTMPAEEEEDESSKEDFLLPWALTAGRFPHSNPCRAWGVAHPLACLRFIQQVP